MNNGELRAATQQRFIALRAVVKQRHAELVTETEARLHEQYREEIKRADELNRRLQEITDEANRKAVAALREFEDLADGGRWSGPRQAMFEAPRFYRPNADRTRRHQALMTGIDKQTRQALRLLDRQQATLLRAPNLARTFLARSIPTIVANLLPSERLREIEAEFNTHTQTQRLRDRLKLLPAAWRR
jgi:hypothetical protein